MFELSPNQVLSTLASRNKAFEISSKNLSKGILDKILIYFSKVLNLINNSKFNDFLKNTNAYNGSLSMGLIWVKLDIGLIRL